MEYFLAAPSKGQSARLDPGRIFRYIFRVILVVHVTQLSPDIPLYTCGGHKAMNIMPGDDLSISYIIDAKALVSAPYSAKTFEVTFAFVNDALKSGNFLRSRWLILAQFYYVLHRLCATCPHLYFLILLSLLLYILSAAYLSRNQQNLGSAV